jgi:hypothetical protein
MSGHTLDRLCMMVVSRAGYIVTWAMRCVVSGWTLFIARGDASFHRVRWLNEGKIVDGVSVLVCYSGCHDNDFYCR